MTPSFNGNNESAVTEESVTRLENNDATSDHEATE